MALGWGEDELKHLFRAYLHMLQDELDGRPYRKVDYNREVQERTGRSKSSVEFKFANVSAVLDDLGLDWVQGYLPRFNYQGLMVSMGRQAIDEHFPQLWDLPQRTQGVRGSAPREFVAGASQASDSGATSHFGDERPVEAVSASSPDMRGSVDTKAQSDVLSFESLWERACGGLSAAVSMHTRESRAWPKGASAPGGDEVLALVRDAHLSLGPSPDELDIVLLIGGPGNGKSELLRKAKHGLEEVGATSHGVAQRRYRYRYPGGHELVVVNDASIPAAGKESADGELIRDLVNAFADRSSVLLAVNRGRLDDRTLHGGGDGSLAETRARDLVKWAHDQSTGTNPDGYVSSVSVCNWDAQDELPAVRCFVVLMDACSLLEQRPTVSLGGAAQQGVSSGHTIAALAQRREVQESTLGGEVLTQFVGRVLPWARELPDWHPIRANVEGLLDPRQRAGLGVWLRAGELAAGRKMTYRELWGAYVRAVIGDIPEAMTREQAKELLATPDPSSYLDLRRLAYLRTHQALMGISESGRRPATPDEHPVLRLTTLIDPVRDADPSWARSVHEAMAFRDPDVGPLATLRSIFEASEAPVPISMAFDEVLDEAFVEHVKGLSSTDRRVEEAWYGAYLLRMHALSIGQCAFRAELELWASEWRSAHKFWQEPTGQAIRTLFFPARRPGASMLLPALQPRAVPLLSSSDTPQFVRQVNTQHILQKVRRGDQLYVRLDLGEVSAEIDFDFALLREAMACVGGGPGVSQHAVATLPRLERFRATLLRHDSGQGYAVVDRDDVVNVETNHAW